MSAFVVRISGADPDSASQQVRVSGKVRLDDRDTLTRRVRAAGVEPDSGGDLALVAAAYRAWGEGMLSHLIGDFAFVVWDPQRRVHFCARDPFGVEPFYYAVHRHGFIASNWMSQVRAEPEVSSELDSSSIVSFLRWGYTVDLAATTFSGIRRLPPGHSLSVDAVGAASEPRRWWEFPDPPPLRLHDDDEYLEGMREVAGRAVRDRLRASTAAILLSGGVDSAGLAAAARRSAADVSLTAYTMDFPGGAPADEVPLARLTAAALGIRHEIFAEDPVVFAHLEQPALATPEPHDDVVFSSWRRVAALISAQAPVLMIGEDGDALFQPPSLARVARRWGVVDMGAQLARFLLTRRRKPHTGFWLRNRIRERFDTAGDGSLPGWVRADLVARTGPQESLEDRSHASRPETAGKLTAPVWASMLERSTQEYAGVPLECVWPLLDQRVLAFALALPPLPWLQQKEIWREAWRGAVPDRVLNRPKTPSVGVFHRQVAGWRRANSGHPIVWSSRSADFIDTRRVDDMLQRGSVSDVVDAWRAISLDRWMLSLA